MVKLESGIPSQALRSLRTSRHAQAHLQNTRHHSQPGGGWTLPEHPTSKRNHTPPLHTNRKPARGSIRKSRGAGQIETNTTKRRTQTLPIAHNLIRHCHNNIKQHRTIYDDSPCWHIGRCNLRGSCAWECATLVWRLSKSTLILIRTTSHRYQTISTMSRRNRHDDPGLVV